MDQIGLPSFPMDCFARLSCYLLYRMASLFPNPLIPMIPGKRKIQIFKKIIRIFPK